MRAFGWFAMAAAAAGVMTACGGSTAVTGPVAATAVNSVAPQGGATNVSVGTSIVMTFSHPMMTGMESFVSLHQGGLTGPAIPMTAAWSADRQQLTMTPNAPLASATQYVIHMGGGMKDAGGQTINYANCPAFGGQTATSAMMGGMMGGMTGEMGNGWKGADGNYGMTFTFTTS